MPAAQDESYDVVVIGAGAAGLMCAEVAARRGRRVALLEHNARVGRKILISGGGRCNFTNLEAPAERYVSSNRHFAKSALSRYRPRDFIARVEAAGIAYHEKTLGQLFCDRSSEQILQMLVDGCDAAGVVTRCSSSVRSVERAPDGFMLTDEKTSYRCQSVVVATGGLSIPQIGATDFGHRIARQFDLAVTELTPALVPFTLNDASFPGFRELAGVSAPAVVRCGKARFAEAVLFTHRGLSGPAILQASLHWTPGQEIEVDWLPEIDLEAQIIEAKALEPGLTVPALLKRSLPKRFADAWCRHRGLEAGRRLAAFKDKELRSFARGLKAWRVIPSGTEGFKKAEVTRGGISTAELSSKTLESKKVAGLFFIGEVVDVTGWLGGYNFQWAWASAQAAGAVA